jgi:hypothetical protein
VCLIVDVNVAAHVLGAGTDANFLPVREALFSGRARLAYGGRLAREYQSNNSVWGALKELDRAGRARVVPGVDSRETELINAGSCISDDEHIIAIAQLGEVRLVCTLDQDLHKDVKDAALLRKPPGRIYQDPTHAHLIGRSCAGKLRPRK